MAWGRERASEEATTGALARWFPSTIRSDVVTVRNTLYRIQDTLGIETKHGLFV